MGKYINRTPNLFIDLFTKQRIPKIYKRIQYLDHVPVTLNSTEDLQPFRKFNKPSSISLIPDYLTLHPIDCKKLLVKTFSQTNLGYAIQINKEFNIEAYLKVKFKNNYRNLRKRYQRFESCFNAEYSFFYGSIDEDKYLYIMDSLKKMLVRRFKQRNAKHDKINEWETLLATTLNQINQKKASLFVIHDDGVPIDISLNYHFDKIMFGAISSYDIDFYKFGMGSIEKIKLLEWCLSNNYRILEFGYGNLHYKKNWSNYTYQFKTQVIYDPTSVRSTILAKIELSKLSLKEYLKSKKIDVLYNKIKAYLSSLRNLDRIEKSKVRYESIIIDNSINYDTLKQVSYDYKSPFPLKSIVIDFLYTNNEHKDHIIIYEVLKEPGSYLISGRKSTQKYSFIN